MYIFPINTHTQYLIGGEVLSGRGLCVSLRAVCVLVEVLHEPEEGKFIKEDLRDVHQQILTTVLQRSADKLTQGLLCT